MADFSGLICYCQALTGMKAIYILRARRVFCSLWIRSQCTLGKLKTIVFGTRHPLDCLFSLSICLSKQCFCVPLYVL